MPTPAPNPPVVVVHWPALGAACRRGLRRLAWLAVVAVLFTALASQADHRQPALDALLADLFGLAASPSASGPDGARAKPAVRRVSTPSDAVLTALADAERLSPFEARFVRYLWLPGGTVQELKDAALSLNIVSRATVPLRLPPVAGLLLARVDLRQFAPRQQDLEDWLRLWEDFQFDPFFALLVTRDTLNLLTPAVRARVAESRLSRDRTLLGALVAGHARAAETLRFTSPGVDARALARLGLLTGSQAPVVAAPYFQARVLTTIKDKGLYALLFGGRYYEFAGIQKAADVKGKEEATDEDLFFERLGIGNIAAGVNAAQFFETLRSDQRLAMFRSGVTGKPRRVDLFHTPSGRETVSWGAITHDVRDQDIDVGSHPVLNLLNAVDQAREAIFDRVNGTHIYALFDGQGKLLDEAGADVAVDRTVPAPHAPRLQCALSCMACHETEGSDGWKSMTNEVKQLLGGKYTKLDVFGDLSQRDRLLTDPLDRLAGLYAGDFSKNLRRARDDYAETVLKITGPWPESKDQVDVVKIAVSHLVTSTRGYQYDLVDAQRALRELGWEVPRDQATAFLGTLLPPDERSAVGAILPEDPRLAALKEGLGIPRADWALVYSFAAERAQRAEAALARKGAN